MVGSCILILAIFWTIKSLNLVFKESQIPLFARLRLLSSLMEVLSRCHGIREYLDVSLVYQIKINNRMMRRKRKVKLNKPPSKGNSLKSEDQSPLWNNIMKIAMRKTIFWTMICTKIKKWGISLKLNSKRRGIRLSQAMDKIKNGRLRMDTSNLRYSFSSRNSVVKLTTFYAKRLIS